MLALLLRPVSIISPLPIVVVNQPRCGFLLFPFVFHTRVCMAQSLSVTAKILDKGAWAWKGAGIEDSSIFSPFLELCRNPVSVIHPKQVDGISSPNWPSPEPLGERQKPSASLQGAIMPPGASCRCTWRSRRGVEKY